MIIKFITTISTLSLLFTSTAYAGMKVWNINPYGDAYFGLYEAYDLNSSCENNKGSLLNSPFNNPTWYDRFIVAPNTPNDLICVVLGTGGWLEGGHPVGYWANPLINTDECEIQFYSYTWGITARAKKECGYTGRCVDGLGYTHGGRHNSIEGTQDYENFGRVCLPYIPD